MPRAAKVGTAAVLKDATFPNKHLDAAHHGRSPDAQVQVLYDHGTVRLNVIT